MPKFTYEDFKELMALGNSPKLASEELLKATGNLIDASGDFNNLDGIKRALKWLDLLKNRNFSSQLQKFEFYYFKSNALNIKRVLTKKEKNWDKENRLIEKEIICLRTAIRCTPQKLDEASSYRLCQAFTNLGNLFDYVGRFVEAIWYFDKALKIRPDFGMAIGNKAIALHYYAKHHYDEGHKNVFVFFIIELLERALNTSNLEGNSKEIFIKYLENAQKYVGQLKLEDIADLEKHSLNTTKREIEFRKWCLSERLFLNPLNDLGKYPIAGRDVLLTPDMVTDSKGSPYLQGFFSWIKQEYVSARYLLYRGLENGKAHFSDKEVFLVDTLDYPAYGYKTELLKNAFRAFYSLLDKVSFFLNDYFKLGIPERDVYFRVIWDHKKIETIIMSRKNFPLEGLYWLSKDIYKDSKEFKEVIEPEAKYWNFFRNSLEHRYLKITSFPVKHTTEEEIKLLEEKFGYKIEREDFIKSIIGLARLTRASLIYLSFAINSEEQIRENGRGGLTAPMPLFIFKDDLKI